MLKSRKVNKWCWSDYKNLFAIKMTLLMITMKIFHVAIKTGECSKQHVFSFQYKKIIDHISFFFNEIPGPISV